MAEAGKKVEVRYGAFACTIEGYDNPAEQLEAILGKMQKMIAETPQFSQVDSGSEAQDLQDALHPKDDETAPSPGIVIIRDSDDRGPEKTASATATDNAEDDATVADAEEVVDDIPVDAEPVEAAPEVADAATEESTQQPDAAASDLTEDDPQGVDEAQDTSTATSSFVGTAAGAAIGAAAIAAFSSDASASEDASPDEDPDPVRDDGSDVSDADAADEVVSDPWDVAPDEPTDDAEQVDASDTGEDVVEEPVNIFTAPDDAEPETETEAQDEPLEVQHEPVEATVEASPSAEPNIFATPRSEPEASVNIFAAPAEPLAAEEPEEPVQEAPEEHAPAVNIFGAPEPQDDEPVNIFAAPAAEPASEPVEAEAEDLAEPATQEIPEPKAEKFVNIFAAAEPAPVVVQEPGDAGVADEPVPQPDVNIFAAPASEPEPQDQAHSSEDADDVEPQNPVSDSVPNIFAAPIAEAESAVKDTAETAADIWTDASSVLEKATPDTVRQTLDDLGERVSQFAPISDAPSSDVPEEAPDSAPDDSQTFSIFADPTPEEPAPAPVPDPSQQTNDRFQALLRGNQGGPVMGAPGEPDQTEMPPSGSIAELAPGIHSAQDLANRAGSESVSDLLAASAAWLTLAQGKGRFSRREVMDVFEKIEGEHPRTLEARIKGYGKLVRSGMLVLVDDGVFAMAQSERQRFQTMLDRG